MYSVHWNGSRGARVITFAKTKYHRDSPRTWYVTPRGLPEMTVYELKKNAVSSPSGVPRLGLPRFGMGEALHGVVTNCGEAVDGNTGCATSFPHALMMAASFNRSLWAVRQALLTRVRSLRFQLCHGPVYYHSGASRQCHSIAFAVCAKRMPRLVLQAVGTAIGTEGRAFWNQGGLAEPNPLGALNFW